MIPQSHIGYRVWQIMGISDQVSEKSGGERQVRLGKEMCDAQTSMARTCFEVGASADRALLSGITPQYNEISFLEGHLF